MNIAHCSNRETQWSGKYCSNCGQNGRDYRKSLPPMFGQLIFEAFELDGRILRSLKALFFKPGQLSAEFSTNRRADYISPLRLYLFSSILFFAVMSTTTEPVSLKIVEQPSQERKFDLDSDVTSEQIAAFAARLGTELQVGLQQVLAREESWKKIAMLGYIQAVTETQNKLFDDIKGGFAHRQVVRGLNDPDQALDQLLEQLPIAMFFLLPAYAALLKLFYLRGKKYFVEHLVFALHLHTFAFLVFTLLLVIPNTEDSIWDTAETLLYVGFTVYYFLALRRFYEQSRARTWVKYFLLINAYGILTVPAMILVMATTFATY